MIGGCVADPCLFCSRSWERCPSRPWRTRPAHRSPPTGSRTPEPSRATRPPSGTPGPCWEARRGRPAGSARRSRSTASTTAIRIPDAGSINLASGMTLEAWVNPSATTGWRAAVVKERLADISYGLYGTGQDIAPAAFTATDGETANAKGSSALPLNTWSHLAATYDGTTCASTSMASRQPRRASARVRMIPGPGPLSIGGSGLGSEWFKGLIDEVRVYDQPLTAAEIQTDMNTPVGSPTPHLRGCPRTWPEAGRRRRTGRSSRCMPRCCPTGRSSPGTPSARRCAPSTSGTRRRASSSRPRPASTSSAPGTRCFPTGACSSPAATSSPTSASRTPGCSIRSPPVGPRAPTWLAGAGIRRPRPLPTAAC